MSVVSVVETVGKDIVKGVEAPFDWIGKAEKVIATAIKNQPQLKTAVLTLVQKAETIAASGAKDVAEKGFSLPDDAATLEQVEDFFSYFQTTFAPIVEAVYEEVKTDIETPTAPATPTPAASISKTAPFA